MIEFRRLRKPSELQVGDVVRWVSIVGIIVEGTVVSMDKGVATVEIDDGVARRVGHLVNSNGVGKDARTVLVIRRAEA